MRDIIKKTLQLGFAQHLCLFTLADEFSPLSLKLVERRFFIMRSCNCQVDLVPKTYGFPHLIIKYLFHYELAQMLESFLYCPRPRSVRARKWKPVPFLDGSFHCPVALRGPPSPHGLKQRRHRGLGSEQVSNDFSNEPMVPYPAIADPF
jgi:hypothetical protein